MFSYNFNSEGSSDQSFNNCFDSLASILDHAVWQLWLKQLLLPAIKEP